MTDKPIIVIGAGMCGISTAIWLQRSGHAVTLMDKGAPGMGASFGWVGCRTCNIAHALAGRAAASARPQ